MILKQGHNKSVVIPDLCIDLWNMRWCMSFIHPSVVWDELTTGIDMPDLSKKFGKLMLKGKTAEGR